MMAGRIIFPIHDHEGTLVRYAGRGKSPKYLNIPGLPRAQILYGLHRVNPAAEAEGMLITAIILYPDVTTHHRGELLTYPTLVQRLLKLALRTARAKK